MPVVDACLAALRGDLDALQHTWAEHGDAVLNTGLSYATGEPVLIRVSKRGRRYDISDDGAATARAGTPAGWMKVATRRMAQDGFNVNRSGVLSVPAVEGRDIATLAWRLGEASRDLYLSLLDCQPATTVGPGPHRRSD